MMADGPSFYSWSIARKKVLRHRKFKNSPNFEITRRQKQNPDVRVVSFQLNQRIQEKNTRMHGGHLNSRSYVFDNFSSRCSILVCACRSFMGRLRALPVRKKLQCLVRKAIISFAEIIFLLYVFYKYSSCGLSLPRKNGGLKFNFQK